VLGLRCLVSAKKTQRDKDWPMIRRLVEADIASHRKPSRSDVQWWFRECRTPELLIGLATRYSATAKREMKKRPLLFHALHSKIGGLEAALRSEELKERKYDKMYWRPLREELERMRHEGKKR
jgi:hypothetical protein